MAFIPSYLQRLHLFQRFAFEHYGVVPDILVMAKGIANGISHRCCVHARTPPYTVHEHIQHVRKHITTSFYKKKLDGMAKKEIFSRTAIIRPIITCFLTVFGFVASPRT